MNEHSKDLHPVGWGLPMRRDALLPNPPPPTPRHRETGQQPLRALVALPSSAQGAAGVVPRSRALGTQALGTQAAARPPPVERATRSLLRRRVARLPTAAADRALCRVGSPGAMRARRGSRPAAPASALGGPSTSTRSSCATPRPTPSPLPSSRQDEIGAEAAVGVCAPRTASAENFAREARPAPA